MKEIINSNPAVQSALVALANTFSMYGTQWPHDGDADGHYDLWRAVEAERMLTSASYYQAAYPSDPALLAKHVAIAANASDSDEAIDDDNEEAAVAISVAIDDLGTALGITFKG